MKGDTKCSTDGRKEGFREAVEREEGTKERSDIRRTV